jgi:hypothetical protein
MAPPPVPHHGSPAPSLHPLKEVLDLASGRIAGWLLDRHKAADAISVAMAPHSHPLREGFLAVRLSSPELRNAGRRLEDAVRLDGLALLLRGPIDREALSVLERARERGAIVGCDATAALAHFAALTPDLLAVSALEPEPSHDDATGAAVLRALTAIADGAGTRVLALDVPSVARSIAMHDLGVALAQGMTLRPARRRPSPDADDVAWPRVARSWGNVLGMNRPALPAASSAEAIVDLCLADPEHDWIVLVDERTHPVCLIERAALLCGEPFEHRAVRVGPGMELRNVAQAAAERPRDDRARPLVLCDSLGRYRGLLSLDPVPRPLAAC